MPVPVPVFLLDSNEKFKPLDVASVEDAELEGRLVDAHGNQTDAPIVLGELPADGGRMNFPPHAEKYEQRLQAAYGNVGYHRVVENGGLQWHQYWLWYIYNPKVIVEVTGEHEGDWEFVQIGCVGETPVCMTNSQHQSGSGRYWWEVTKREDGRPLVYVAVDSHANYFVPVSDIPWIGDDADGEGEALDNLDWHDFGDWKKWPGQWGNSTGPGRSPQSPACQGARWSAPAKYHSVAQGKR
jgi:hypothetical protein